jgi:hypothetical protein
MQVTMMPAAVGEATVKVQGKPVGIIRAIEAPGAFVGYDGHQHTGARWVPVGWDVDPDVEGPVTMQDAALLLLALTGHDHAQAATALGYPVAS